MFKLKMKKSNSFSNENLHPVKDLHKPKVDTTIDEDEVSHSEIVMSRTTAMTILGLWKTRSLSERNSSELVITQDEVNTAFR